jgi:hypothetical protein
MGVFQDFYTHSKFVKIINATFLALILEREALHPFFKILCFPLFLLLLWLFQGRREELCLFPSSLLPSSSLLSSRLLLFPSASLGS